MFDNNTDLYKVLGVSKDADQSAIKKNYRKMALKYHPDRNKDNKDENEKKFKEISRAYEILSDENKRKMYDTFGMDAVNNGAGNMGDNPFDLFGNIFSQSNGFENMFNMGSRSQQSNRNRNRKSPNLKKNLDVTLEDIYCKRNLNLVFEKTIKCRKCKGTGAKDSGSIKKCSTCDGTGITISIKTFGPGMISQSQSTCNLCRGTGKIISAKCDKCLGTKYESIKKKINIKLDHGNIHNDKLVVHNEAHEDVDCDLCGDLILHLNVKEHKNYKRIGNNLHITKSINLVDALCGCELTFTHLDNRKLLVKTGDIINPSMKKKINGEGFNGGDFVISFDIMFPKSLSKERKEYISKLLPINKKQQVDYSDFELKMLENHNEILEEEYKSEENNYQNEDEDSPNIGCATQ